MFGEVIGYIEENFSTHYIKTDLFDFFFHPVESHVENFGAILTHGGSLDSLGDGVVGY